MRRGLHCLLVGVLTFSMSVDTAKACWHRRGARSCRRVSCVAPADAGRTWSMCPPVAGGPCCPGAEVVHGSCEAGCTSSDRGAAWGQIVGGLDETSCGQPIACCVESEAMLAVEAGNSQDGAPATVVEGTVVESVIAPSAPTPVALPTEKPAAESAVEPQPITIPPQALADKPASAATVEPAAVPDLKSVEPVTALEPAAPPSEKPSEKPAEPAAPPVADAQAPASEPAKPKEENIFEEVENASADATAKPTDKPETPEAVPAPSFPLEPVLDPPAAPAATEPAAKPPAAVPPAGAADPAPAPASDPVEPPAADGKPVGEDKPVGDDKPAGENQPSDEAKPRAADEPAAAAADETPDNASNGPREPMRRWIDATGTYATLGSFIDLRDDGIEIRKANGRVIRVPLDRLSSHDRAYAAEAGARVAARRTSSPAVSETAGL